VQYSLWYVVPNTLPVGDLVPPLADHRPATYTSYIAQSNAPGENCCPKHVELNWI